MQLFLKLLGYVFIYGKSKKSYSSSYDYYILKKIQGNIQNFAKKNLKKVDTPELRNSWALFRECYLEDWPQIGIFERANRSGVFWV